MFHTMIHFDIQKKVTTSKTLACPTLVAGLLGGAHPIHRPHLLVLLQLQIMFLAYFYVLLIWIQHYPFVPLHLDNNVFECISMFSISNMYFLVLSSSTNSFRYKIMFFLYVLFIRIHFVLSSNITPLWPFSCTIMFLAVFLRSTF